MGDSSSKPAEMAIVKVGMRTWMAALGLFTLGADEGGSGERSDFATAICALESSEAETWTDSLGPR
jgi:hypothetical protein